MRKNVFRRVVVLLVLAALAASPLAAGLPGVRVTGTIETVEEDEKRFALEDAEGERHLIHWNEETAFLTRPRPGLRMRIYYVAGDGGRKLALRVGKAEKPSRL